MIHAIIFFISFNAYGALTECQIKCRDKYEACMKEKEGTSKEYKCRKRLVKCGVKCDSKS